MSIITTTAIRNTLEKDAWWLAVLACCSLVTIDLAGAATTPGYSLWRDTVSHQMTPDAAHASILRAALFIYGLLLVPFAIRVGQVAHETRWWRTVLVTGIWMHIALMVAAGLFQNDSTASILGLVSVNTVHDLGSIALFGAAELTLLAVALSAGSPRKMLSAVRSRVSLLAMLSMALIMVVALTTSFNGITERVNTAVFMGWMVTLPRMKS